MRMQDVIGKLREEAPLLDKFAGDADHAFQKVWSLFDDYRRAESFQGRRVLADAISEGMLDFSRKYQTLRTSIDTLCLANAEYKEKLGPRAKKPKDDPRQMEMDFNGGQK